MLKPNIKVVENSDGFIHYDVTGSHSSSNSSGYGVKNPGVGDVTKASIVIKSPNDESTYTFIVTGDMPRTDGVGYLFRPEMIGGFVTPGVWSFKMILEVDDDTYESNWYKVLASYQADCCVNKLRNKIDTRLVLQGDPYQKRILLLSASLKGAKWAYDQGRFSDAQKVIEVVYANCKCDCCF